MGVTYGELKTRLAKVLFDPNKRTFTDDLIEELVMSGLTEVGRIAPEQFTEDLTPVTNQLSYQLRADAFGVVTYSVTATAVDNLFASNDHGLVAGNAIVFSDLVGGTGIVAGTTYWVIDDGGLDADFFRVSTELGGGTIDVTTDLTSGSWAHLRSGVAVPEIEPVRVEVWDASQAPERLISRVLPASQQPIAAGDTGWSMWGGLLTLPTRTVAGLTGHESDYVIRVWGYSPYIPPEQDGDVIAISREQEQAVVWYAKIEAIDMLLASRDLYTQWQTRSGNTDIGPAGLMNQRSIAESMWRAKSRAITRLRSEV